LTESFQRQRTVRSPVASEVWTYTDGKGRKQRTEITLGTPRPIPGDKNGDWFCPIYISGWMPHVIPALGIGPIDSLTNALALVRAFREHVADMNIETDRGAACA
jgi:hypothetical protein